MKKSFFFLICLLPGVLIVQAQTGTTPRNNRIPQTPAGNQSASSQSAASRPAGQPSSSLSENNRPRQLMQYRPRPNAIQFMSYRRNAIMDAPVRMNSNMDQVRPGPGNKPTSNGGRPAGSQYMNQSASDMKAIMAPSVTKNTPDGHHVRYVLTTDLGQ